MEIDEHSSYFKAMTNSKSLQWLEIISEEMKSLYQNLVAGQDTKEHEDCQVQIGFANS